MRYLLGIILASSAWAAAPTCSAGSAFTMVPGTSYTLDGSGSHSNGGTGLTYKWDQMNGRTRVRFSSQTVASPTIRGVVAGLYYFRLTVTDSGGTANCTVSPVGISAAARTTPVVRTKAFALASVPNATLVRCTLMTHTGEVVRGTAATSPCSVSDPSPNPDVLYWQVEYFNSSGHLLASSDREFKPNNDTLDTRTKLMYPVYTTVSTEPAKEYLAKKYGMLTGDNDFRPANPNVLTGGYVDAMYLYAYQQSTLVDWAAATGYSYEDALHHSLVDYTVNACNNPSGDGNCNWYHLDQFDALDSATSGGVYLLNGSTYTDKTVAAYDSTTGDVAITDKLLIGYSEPFDRVNFTFSTPATGVTMTWQYWNGTAYSTLLPASDTTSGLTTDGMLVFVPRANWAKHSENGGRAKYWIRLTVTGGTVNPTASRIYGDDWHAGANVARGWDLTDPNIINVGYGALEYNPTPPVGATARFRYQARLTGVWAPNSMMGNHGSLYGSVYLWGNYLTYQMKAALAGLTKDTIFLDDAGVQSYYPQADLDVSQATTLDQQKDACFTYVSATMRAYQSNYVNVYNGADGAYVDMTLLEAYAIGNTWTGEIRTDFYNKYVVTWPNTIPITMYFNHVYDPLIGSPFTLNMSNWTWYDVADRFSMVGLAKHYIGGKERNFFAHSQDGARYNDQDEYFYVDSTPTTTLTADYGLATTLTADVSYYSTSEYALPVADNAGFPAPGTNFGIRIGTAGSTTGQMLYAYTKTADTTNIYVSGQYVLPHSSGDEVFLIPLTGGIQLTVGSTLGLVASGAGGWASNKIIRIGDPASGGGEIVQATTVDGTHFTTDRIWNAYPSGTPIYAVKAGKLSATNVLPPLSRIIRWGQYFPAMGVDIGTYDTAGYNGGQSDFGLWPTTGTALWKSGADVTQDATKCGAANHRAECQGISRRDYTKALVFFRPSQGSQYTAPNIGPVWESAQICITGGTYPACTGPDYYPLHADGTTGAGQKYIQLRELEGAIMMKLPQGPGLYYADLDNGPTTLALSWGTLTNVLWGTMTASQWASMTN